MDDDYYHFTIEHSVLEDGVHIADVESLICLKSKAFVDLSTRKQNGGHVDSKYIQKHKKEVFRLAAMLAPVDRVELPNSIKEDVRQFVNFASGISLMPISSVPQVCKGWTPTLF